ncbi:hypothetical protein DPMN_179714 [Dreissena polymorpha]|uniref:Uncharacterized protein n=1 Tax=Dreissena polymorpha TaxID=45954 RepID=A0A9D4EFK8_DREPO|nr:hypothetical protein DPMN_179714 [Dreissena polymorpha]
MSSFVTNTKNENRDSSELTIEKRLEEISSKLSNVLTKDGSIFIKVIIKETVEQLKEKLLGNVIRRIEILENDVFEQKRENEQLKKESESKSKQFEDLQKSQNAALENKQPCDTLNHEEFANNTEQYSRRNNIRIACDPQDQDRQSSVSVTQKIVELVNSHLRIPIQPYDIDIAHRLGKFRPNSNRPVIVRFVRRQTKISEISEINTN